jgi:branched-chain amino acid transport system permease protein
MSLRWKYSRPLLIASTVVLFIAPFVGNTPLTHPGIQQTLAVAFLYGALALTYDLLFGFTGLLSFGHALFFASGMYLSVLFINHSIFNWWLSIIMAILITTVGAILIGSASLRTGGITFAMVTLAFAEAGHVVVSRNFGGLTNGENGLALNADKVPHFFIGVFNTKYLYISALIVLTLIFLATWWVVESSAGRVFAALRENETRVSVLGLKPARFKLLSFVIGASMASLVGVAMLFVSGNATPRFASAEVTISLLLMVVLGGAMTRWGAVLGGIIYSVASTRLQEVSQSSALHSIPKIIRGPLSEPTFILGLIFIFIVMFAPGGLSGAYYRLRLRALSKK